MFVIEKCHHCNGKGYQLVVFPGKKEACFYCEGTGQLKRELDFSNEKNAKE
ncbi:hypothetical protein [Bacillus licheniformis]|uniref:hypothetical protein n=1 Tax=Bacillus licheniformis TaxID=1402 RepID=UPI00163A5D6B|nr:hypothetical protein [Bacillus licheniformis]